MKRFLVGMMSFLLFAACNNPKPDEAADTTTPATAETKAQPAEFADPKYTEIGKSGLASMTSGDIDAWSSNWADNIVWQWNNGDSIVGKAAVVKYWKDRRSNNIDSINFTNQIWLPVKVNQTQGTEAPGVWLLSWYSTNAKYKTGKRMMQSIHTVQHFDANDKIDRVVQYLDRVPINAAMAK